MRTSTSSELSDSELMLRLGHGDTQALGEIYLRYVSVVRSALSRQAPELPRAQRDELTQDVFLSLLELVHPKSERQYRDEERLKAFLYGISVRKARMWRRQTWLRRHLLQRHADRPIAMAQASEGGRSPEQHSEAREAVAHAFARLPDAQREVLLLHAEGYSGDEIAHQLNIRPKTVWTRLHRARSALLAVALLGAGLCVFYFGLRDSRDATANSAQPRTSTSVDRQRSGTPSTAQANLTISSQAKSDKEHASPQRDASPTSSSAHEGEHALQAPRSGRLSVHIAGSEQADSRVRELTRERAIAGETKVHALRTAVIEGRLAEAESGLRAYLKHSDRDAVAWSLLGDCLRKRGQWQDAVDAYRVVMRVGQHAEAQRARFLAASVLQDRLAQPRAVIALLEGYGDDQVIAPEARLRLARALLDIGDIEEAHAILQAILAQKPTSSSAREARRLLDESARMRP